MQRPLGHERKTELSLTIDRGTLATKEYAGDPSYTLALDVIQQKSHLAVYFKSSPGVFILKS